MAVAAEVEGVEGEAGGGEGFHEKRVAVGVVADAVDEGNGGTGVVGGPRLGERAEMSTFMFSKWNISGR